MEIYKKTNINESEKLALLQQAWDDKKERLSNAGSQALYVALDSPKPNVALITAQVLSEVYLKSSAEDWARRWGRVVVCVKAGGEPLCLLGDVNDDKNKAFVPVSTSVRILPAELIQEFPTGDLGTVLLNNRETTIEAIVIAYIHMVDELIWDLYRQKLQDANLTSSKELYAQTVSEVMRRGFSVGTATEEEILMAKKYNPQVSIRLYGSGVSKDVSKVMGAVVPAASGAADGGVSFIQKLKQAGSREVKPDKIEAEVVEEKGLKPVLVAGVTLGKELHAGHCLLLATADLLKSNLGEEGPLVLVNNNTGPRAAGALVTLACEAGLGLEETAVKMSSGEIPVEQIVTSYRGRTEKGELADAALKLLDEGRYDIFASIADLAVAGLDKAGFDVRVVAESQGLSEASRILGGINPLWKGSGFSFLSSGQSIKVLQKGGFLTATGKCVTAMANVAKQCLGFGQFPMMIFVDGSTSGADAVATISSMPDLGKAAQVAGAAIGFDGKMASGSFGEALALRELIAEYSKRGPEHSLRAALRGMVLTRPLTIPIAKRPDLSCGFYDFYDNDSFVRALVECRQESENFRSSVVGFLGQLQQKVGDLTQAENQSAQKALAHIREKSEAIKGSKAEDIIRALDRFKIVGVSGEFCKLEHGLARFIPKIDARTLILEALSQGVDTASAISALAKPMAVNMPQPLFGNDFRVSCSVLEAVKKQGYAGVEAIKKVEEYLDGPKGLVIRENYFLKMLVSLMRLGEQIVTIKPEDFAMLSGTMQFCMERLGYETV